VGTVRVYVLRMNNLMNVIGVLGLVFLSIFPALFVLFMVVYMNRNGRKRHYLLRSARRYSISPLFGQSRQTLLREAQNRSI